MEEKKETRVKVNPTYLSPEQHSDQDRKAWKVVIPILVILFFILVAAVGCEDGFRFVLVMGTLVVVVAAAIWIIRIGVRSGIRDTRRRD